MNIEESTQRVVDPGFRVSSGVVQFGDDWPGIFIRGDQAGGLSDVLRMIAAEVEKDPTAKARESIAKYLRELSDNLGKCYI